MHKKMAAVAIGIMVFAMSATAQITGSGTSGTVPVFTGPSTEGNSPITVSGGNVGIGTTNPAYMLQVGTDQSVSNGQIAIGKSNGTGGFREMVLGYDSNFDFGLFDSGNTMQFGIYWSAPANSMYINGAGNVGIGTTAPLAPLDVRNTSTSKTVGTSAGLATFYSNDAANPFGLAMWFAGAASLANRSLNLQTQDANLANGGNLSLQAASGNVGIGTTTPGAKLEVSGNILLTSGSGASITFPDGTKQGTAWTGMTCGGDYAESVDVSGDRTDYEPGDVLVIDPNAPGKILKSVEPYSTLVSGIYSTKPGVVGRRQAGDPKNSTTEIPMAMVGIVPTKVSAENGPIRTGDLLVASATMGYAMKGTDRSRMLGAVIGKAFGNLDSGTGVIEVLVTLQ